MLGVTAVPLPLLDKAESSSALVDTAGVVLELWTTGCTLCACRQLNKTGWLTIAMLAGNLLDLQFVVLMPIRIKQGCPVILFIVSETKHKVWTEQSGCSV